MQNITTLLEAAARNLPPWAVLCLAAIVGMTAVALAALRRT